MEWAGNAHALSHTHCHNQRISCMHCVAKTQRHTHTHLETRPATKVVGGPDRVCFRFVSAYFCALLLWLPGKKPRIRSLIRLLVLCARILAAKCASFFQFCGLSPTDYKQQVCLVFFGGAQMSIKCLSSKFGFYSPSGKGPKVRTFQQCAY